MAPDPVTLSEEIGLTNIAPSIEMSGRTVVITGGGAGIGKAVSEAYVRFGAHVIAIGERQEALDELQEELGMDKVSTICFDLRERSDEAYTELGQQIETLSGGTVDGYIINAGVIKMYQGEGAMTLSRTPMAECDDVFAINTRSHLALFQKLLPMLQKSDAGRIVLTSSPIVGRKDPSSAHYAWTKKALEDLMEMARQEMRQDPASANILVTGYVPPPVQVWLRAHWKNEPYGCNPLPEDVVELPLRLGSPSLPAETDGKVFTYVDKRQKGIVPKDGGEPYDANDRTQSGYDLGINVRHLGEGGGTAGDTFLPTYDTWTARQLMGVGPAPALDESTRLRSLMKAPTFVAQAMKQKID